MTIWEFFKETFAWLVDQYDAGELNDAIQKAKRAINLTQERARQWWFWAKFLAVVCIAGSVILFCIAALVGGFIQAGWPNALAGLLIAPALFVLLIWWIPLVAIIAVIGEIIHLRFKSAPSAAVAWAKWWLGATCGILLWQVIVSLAFTFIPYWNAPSRIPVMILLSLAMALIGVRWGNLQKHRAIIKTLVVVAFIAQVAVCFIPQLATLATASTSRLGKNVEATAARVAREGFFPTKPPTPPPPRDLGWQKWEVKLTTNSVVRVYNGDEFIYKSLSPFKVVDEGGKEYLHNPTAASGEERSFKFYNVPAQGEKIKILPIDATSVFWLDFRIESRRTL